MTIEVRASNPDEGLYSMLKCLFTKGNQHVGNSRNGPVTRFIEPVSLVWTNPMHRVSFDPVRDANPAFHLFESFWMLAGENDVARPAYFASGMSNFSDNGTTFEGAYGYRWKRHFGHDQLEHYILPSLAKNKEDRRCVLAMWDGKADPLNGLAGGKDLCCNLSAVFDASMGPLHMTVTNRSNDIVWGACGANAVHFAFLQEYVAGCLGIPVGNYTQFSTNSHIYNEFPGTKAVLQAFKKRINLEGVPADGEAEHPYQGFAVPMFSKGVEPALKKMVLDKDIERLLENYDQLEFEFESFFFKQVVAPVIRSYNLYKKDRLEQAVHELKAAQVQSDWVIATTAWIEKRQHIRNVKIATLPTGKIEEEAWAKVVKQVWTSATKRTVKSEMGELPAFEAEVWQDGKTTLENVGMYNDGMVTIRARGEKA